MEEKRRKASVKDIGVAVDVGSTTIGVCCVDLFHEMEILSFSFANPQHIYGADVMTRIKRCVEDSSMLCTMHMLVEDELHTLLKEYMGASYANISTIVYSGNTTMLHILRELSVDGLARAPFQPIDIDYFEKCNDDSTIQCVMNVYLPGFSAFVGADILVGAKYLQMGQTDSYELLIDLGTNGELLLMNRKNGYATSTACGPVFDHVISGAKYGSESMKLIANCVRRGLIDQSGKLADALFENGIVIDKNLTVKQEHIRNFQLAKGAIYAGIQCLLEQASITANEVSKVHISGGLGFYMNPKDAFTLKMLPTEFADKIAVSGNTSLEGARQWLMAEDLERIQLLGKYQEIKNITKCMELSNLRNFQDYYIHSLEF